MTSAIILAGGLGTRLRETVKDVPKPMAPIHNRPFLEHQMDYWIAQGVTRFVLSVGYRHESIMDHFGTSYRHVPVAYAIEKTPLGTGGGLLLGADVLQETTPFLALNGDSFFEVDLKALKKFHAAHGNDWTFALFRSQETGRYMGMDMQADGKVLGMASGSGKPGKLVNGGVYLINPEILKRAGLETGRTLSLEDDILPNMLAAGETLRGLESTGRFIDIGIPDDYIRAADMLPRRAQV